MKKSLLFIILFVPAVMLGQDTVKHWKWTGITGLNLNQASFSNWTAGGVNSVAFSALGKYTADYKKNKLSWNNNLNLKYGMIKNEDESLKKNEDLIEFISVVGYDLSRHWAFTGYASFKSQFANGYDKDNDTIRISRFMAPGYVTLSPALRYQPVEWFYLMLSPVTARWTFVLDQDLANVGAFGVKPAEYDTSGMLLQEGENSLLYLGPFMEAYMKKDLAKNLNFESRLNIMYTFLNRDQVVGNELEPYDMDVSWENFLNYQFAKYFAVNLFLHFVYFPGQPVITFENYSGAVKIEAKPNRHLQIKETLGIGITYTFPSSK